jgi:hypothetical protein
MKRYERPRPRVHRRELLHGRFESPSARLLVSDGIAGRGLISWPPWRRSTARTSRPQDLADLAALGEDGDDA